MPPPIHSDYRTSGFFGSATWPAPTWKIRDFVWAYQPEDATPEDPWLKIPETDLYANRYQLIFRFPRIHDVNRMRLLIRPVDPLEVDLFPNTYPSPCLREVSFCGAQDARIPVKPWFYTLVTFEAPASSAFGSVYTVHNAGPSPTHKLLVRDTIFELTGRTYGGTNPNDPTLDPAYADMHDVVWFAEFHDQRVVSFDGTAPPGNVSVRGHASPLALGCSGQGCLGEVTQAAHVPAWITHEPEPAGFLLTRNYLDYKDRSAELASGLYHFLREARYPMLGTCGGHQLLAMAALSPSWRDFALEFHPQPDSAQQAVVTCTTLYDPAVYTDPLTGQDCTRTEHGGINKRMAANGIGGIAMPNSHEETRQDLILNTLDDVDGAHPEGFLAKFWHYDLVSDAGAFASVFHLIGTYERHVTSVLDYRHFTLVQAMKQRGRPVYGTQFHWDAFDGVNESPRVAKNFLSIAMSEVGRPSSEMQLSTDTGDEGALFDLDKATVWCSEPGLDGVLTFTSIPRLPLSYILLVTPVATHRVPRPQPRTGSFTAMTREPGPKSMSGKSRSAPLQTMRTHSSWESGRVSSLRRTGITASFLWAAAACARPSRSGSRSSELAPMRLPPPSHSAISQSRDLPVSQPRNLEIPKIRPCTTPSFHSCRCAAGIDAAPPRSRLRHRDNQDPCLC